MSEPRSLDDLEPDFRRAGVDAGEALRLFVNRNDPFGPQVAPGEPIAIELNFSMLQRILRSLPDGTGTERFVNAWAAEGRLWWRDGPGAGGAVL